MDIRDWLRTWLFREESHRISSIMRQALEQRDAIAAARQESKDQFSALTEQISRQFQIVDEFARASLRVTTDLQNTLRDADREAAGQHYRDTDRREAELAEKLDELAKLIEPNVSRIRAPRPSPLGDWDEVQRQNLKQFEDNNGKPLRK